MSNSSGGFAKYINTYRLSKKPFNGADKYVYYENNKPVYVYANYDISKNNRKSRYRWLLVFVPIFIIEVFLLTMCFKTPSKLDNTDSYIHIYDDLSVLGDTYDLGAKLYGFYETTGITPAIYTMSNSSWNGHYSNIENYIYELYVNMFEDENHCFIVFSGGESEGSWNDGNLVVMCGKAAGLIFSDEYIDKFTEIFQKRLDKASEYPVSDALITALENITPTIMEQRFNIVVFAIMLILLVCTCVSGYILVFRNANKYYPEARRITKSATEAACDYCGGVYVVGSCTTCPHCGAYIQLSNS